MPPCIIIHAIAPIASAKLTTLLPALPLQSNAAEVFKRYKEAYETLSDARSKAEYDAQQARRAAAAAGGGMGGRSGGRAGNSVSYSYTVYSNGSGDFFDGDIFVEDDDGDEVDFGCVSFAGLLAGQHVRRHRRQLLACNGGCVLCGTR